MAINTRDLHPIVKDLMDKFVELCQAKGDRVMITQAYRTKAEQDALYAQGRTKPGKIVTNAKGGYSNHNYGLSFDYVPLDGTRAIWDANNPLWSKFGLIGESLGLEWGARWKQLPDRPHLQYTFGLSINDLVKGKRPPSVVKLRGPSELQGLKENQLIRTKVGIYKIV